MALSAAVSPKFLEKMLRQISRDYGLNLKTLKKKYLVPVVDPFGGQRIVHDVNKMSRPELISLAQKLELDCVDSSVKELRKRIGKLLSHS